jgi:hypothetical protein
MRLTQTAGQPLSEYLKRQPHEIELLGDLY